MFLTSCNKNRISSKFSGPPRNMNFQRKFKVLVNFRPFQRIWQWWNIENFRVQSKLQLCKNIGLAIGLFTCLLAAPVECTLGVIKTALEGFNMIKLCILLPVIATMLGMPFAAISFIIKNRQIEQLTDEIQKIVETRNFPSLKKISFFT